MTYANLLLSCSTLATESRRAKLKTRPVLLNLGQGKTEYDHKEENLSGFPGNPPALSPSQDSNLLEFTRLGLTQTGMDSSRMSQKRQEASAK